MVKAKERTPTTAQADALGVLICLGATTRFVYTIDMRAFTAQSLVVRGWAERKDRGDRRMKVTQSGREVYRAACAGEREKAAVDLPQQSDSRERTKGDVTR